jgi:hypothetical protein
VQASAPLSFEDAMAAAARKATEAVTKALRDYRHGYLRDEDDITPYLLGFLRIALNGSIGGLTWTASVASHRGRSAEERRTGADILIHVRLDTPTEKYGKGVLVQAKRLEQDSFLPNRELERLQGAMQEDARVHARGLRVRLYANINAGRVRFSNNRNEKPPSAHSLQLDKLSLFPRAVPLSYRRSAHRERLIHGPCRSAEQAIFNCGR